MRLENMSFVLLNEIVILSLGNGQLAKHHSICQEEWIPKKGMSHTNAGLNMKCSRCQDTTYSSI